jgi:hypothetical protein
MTTTDAITDIAQIEAAEGALESALTQLHRTAAAPEFNADDDDDDDDAEPSIALRLEWVIKELTDALDSLQLGLGRPYVWLLSRS